MRHIESELDKNLDGLFDNRYYSFSKIKSMQIDFQMVRNF